MKLENQDIQQIATQWQQQTEHSFVQLVDAVRLTHSFAQTTAVRAINRMATLRNWLIGYYVVEYEQKGEDRAKYGEQLLEKLADAVNLKGINVTTLEQSRRFYVYYPQLLPDLGIKISATPLQKLAPTEIPATPSQKFVTPADKIVNYLSFSHLREIMTQSDPLARYFYETECIRGGWSVRELRRQEWIRTCLSVHTNYNYRINQLLNIF